MKNISIFLLLFLFVIQPIKLISQDKNPIKLPFKSYDESHTYTGLDDALTNIYGSSLDQNFFLLGWHWGGIKKINDALKTNASHPSFKPSLHQSNYTGGTYMLRGSNGTNTGRIWSKTNEITKLNARAIQYEPTIFIENPGELVQCSQPNDGNDPIQNDFTQSPFGFKSFHSSLISQKGNQRLVLDHNANYVNTSTDLQFAILQKPWIEPHLQRIEMIEENHEKYDGQIWKVSINLRRLNSNDNDLNDLKVLSIKIPFWINNNVDPSGYLYFDSIPDASASNEMIVDGYFGNFRGLTRQLYGFDDNINTFIITKNMIPLGNSSNKDITLSASIDFTNIGNSKVTSNGFGILKSGLEIYYHGNSDIAIDWIRFETPNAQALFKGALDDEIQEAIQGDINYFTNPTNSFIGDGKKLFRFYSIDESDYMYWADIRYFNALIDNLSIAAETQPYTNLYYYYVQPRNYWHEFAKMGPLPSFTPPYLRKNEATIGETDENKKYEMLGFKCGFWGLGEVEGDHYRYRYKDDSAKSCYETFLWPDISIKFFSDRTFNSITKLTASEASDYFRDLSEHTCFQAQWEVLNIFGKFVDFEEFYNSNLLIMPQTGFQYSDKPWWAQVFVNSTWGIKKPEHLAYCDNLILRYI